jgi:XTP/dITP diphosphohydrolase
VAELLFASSNPHKLEEVRAVLEPLGITVLGLDALASTPPEPDEPGHTFEENARIKAVEYARMTARPCLADDSGLEVDALGGAPGVHSARYAGSGGTRAERDEANNRKLLQALEGVPAAQRSARFVCAMCLADADGMVMAETRGTFDGVVGEQPAGRNGFGYDPLLVLPDLGCTSAELSPEEKNARSHRGRAARAMAEELRVRGLLVAFGE